MAQLTVGVSLDGLPRMLRDIILQSLAASPELRIAQLGDAGPYDAMVIAADGTAEARLRGGAAARVVDVAPGGRQAWVHWLEHRLRVIDQFPPGWLAAAITESLERPPVPRVKRLSIWPFRRRKALPAPEPLPLLPATEAASPDTSSREDRPPEPPPRPARSGDDAVGRELARIAARILEARAAPAANGELDAFLHQLASLSASGGDLPGLERFSALFDLTADERDLLFLAGAVELDARAARLVALLNGQPTRSRPTPGLLVSLGGQPHGLIQGLITDGPLVHYALVSVEGDGPLSARPVRADAAVWPLLFGLDRAPPFKTYDLTAPEAEPLPLPDGVEAALGQAGEALSERPPHRILMAVVGDEDVGRAQIARRLAGRVSARAIAVSGTTLTDAAALASVAREARLADAAVVLTEPEEIPPPVWRTLTERLQAPLFLVVAPDLLGPLALTAARPFRTVEAPRRDLAHRERLWAARAPDDWPESSPADIAARFDFGARRIAAALSLARAQAETQGRETPTPGDAKAASERLRETRLGGAAERLECAFEPEDIVLPEATQRELDLAIAWADHGARLFGGTGPGASLHAGAGLACLFTGPPGTGKTMAAQIIARQIDYALYRVDLSQVVDKYIGEGEKRISSLFREASRSRVALFFDEADALFGKRTEVKDSHDRYANIAVDHLLQELEGFDGLSILASNLPGNIDAAFMRRIRVRADFPAPEFMDRRRIWDRLLPPAKDRDPEIRIEQLADPFDLVGGEIRNAIYTAHLMAAQRGETLAMRHLVRALARELAKSGRVAEFADLPSATGRVIVKAI